MENDACQRNLSPKDQNEEPPLENFHYVSYAQSSDRPCIEPKDESLIPKKCYLCGGDRIERYGGDLFGWQTKRTEK